MSRDSIVDTILRIESGGRNVHQSLGTKDINNNYGRGGGNPAQGYFQIIDPTWARYGGLATGYKSAYDAPYDVQLKVAQNIPIGQWGPNTQAALRAAGYNYSGRQTLGDVMAAAGEVPGAAPPARPQQGPLPTGKTLDTVMPPAAAAPAGTNEQQKPGSPTEKIQDAIGGLGTAMGTGAQQPQARFAAPQFMQTGGGQAMPMIAEHPVDAMRRDMLARLMQSYGIA